jgi:bifunctional UDP-N-acetylglucosamine pyrophosphorylase/glucosamine-1-phosphate N-acetyltransferase/UDP-N-acetylglucosamine pyrophosphorylase
MADKIAVVILAAGLGKRMKSPKAKVLHEVLGKPMVVHVVEAARQVAGDAVVVVVGNQAEEVRREVSRCGKSLFALQEKQLGTGHAVMCGLPLLPADCGSVVILCGDVPLVRVGTLRKLIDAHSAEARDATVLVVELEKPYGYGRVLLNSQGGVRGIVEEADATEAERAIKIINTGIYCIKRGFLEATLPKLGRENAQGEFYLTDIIRLGYEQGQRIGVACGDDPDEILGVNTPQDLARVEDILLRRRADIS